MRAYANATTRCRVASITNNLSAARMHLLQPDTPQSFFHPVRFISEILRRRFVAVVVGVLLQT